MLGGMRVFVTGATGFIGGRVVRLLRARGDEVVALVRSPHKAEDLRGLQVSLVEGDLSDRAHLERAMRGCDLVIHAAAMYKAGIASAACNSMRETNLTGTRNVLQAAVGAEAQRILYVSTVGYFGNTRGRVVDESFTRTDFDWLSCYDETKYLAHQVALEMAADGAPIVIAMPGGVYGPGDTSDLRLVFDMARRGWAKVLVLPETGFNFVHIDDAADGILLAAERGTVGEAYVLGGELATAGDLVKKLSALAGHKPPTRKVPVPLLRAAAPLWWIAARAMGLPPNLKELIRAGAGVTYWATDEKARRQLGYSPRTLDDGLRQTLASI